MLKKILNIFSRSKTKQQKLKTEEDDHKSSEQCNSYWKENPEFINQVSPPRLPWLTLPHDLNSTELSFYDLSQCKVHTLVLPKQLSGSVFVGSSKGWLIFAKSNCFYSIAGDIFGDNNAFGSGVYQNNLPIPETVIFLFNPISQAIHRLPPLSTIPSFGEFFHIVGGEDNFSSFIGKIELSSTEISRCTVAGLFNKNTVLGFCKPGGSSWRIYESDHHEDYTDMLFYNDAFHVITSEVNTVTDYQIYSDVELEEFEFYLKLIPGSILENEYNHPFLGDQQVLNDHLVLKNCFKHAYLVESTNGELLLFVKLIDVYMKNNHDVNDDDYFDDDVDNEYHDDNYEGGLEDSYAMFLKNYMFNKTSAFEVFRVDLNNNSCRFKKLENIGNQHVFLMTHGDSLAVLKADQDSADNEQNCIYFADNAGIYDGGLINPQLSRESGVYFLDTKKIQRSIPSLDLPMESRMSWFTPEFP